MCEAAGAGLDPRTAVGAGAAIWRVADGGWLCWAVPVATKATPTAVVPSTHIARRVMRSTPEP